jgi:hypothetical protein
LLFGDLVGSNRLYGNGFIEGMTACFDDRRQAGKVEHTMDELLKQRIYGSFRSSE